MNPETPQPDPVFSRICETSARLMGGVVNRTAMKELQKLVRSESTSYPWEEVVDRVLSSGPPAAELATAALKSQRDWIVRGGRQTPGKNVRHRAKSMVARLMARLVFMAILLASVVALLILCKLRWPGVDIYLANDWLAAAWPAGFGPR
ncbi:MAG: hypothetical protein VX951_11210 [Planctomycetota bacterium]|nr:hypothetical protein [Planctomycetota bacterium]